MAFRRGPIRTASGPAIAGLLACALLVAAPARGQVVLESLPQTDGVGVVDRRGEQVDPALRFTDHDGEQFALGARLGDELPVVLLLAYYDCPLLCDLMLESVSSSLSELDIRPGEDFSVLVVSIDHTNSTEQASKKRERFLGAWRPALTGAQAGAITFATSPDAEQVRALAGQVGYYYRYLPENGEFSHPPALMFLKADGTLHTTLIGVGTDARQVMMAISDAADGKPASLFQQVLFSCFSYNPDTGQYTATAWGVMRIIGISTAVLVGGTLGWLFWSGRRRDRRAGESDPILTVPDTATAGHPTA